MPIPSKLLGSLLCVSIVGGATSCQSDRPHASGGHDEGADSEQPLPVVTVALEPATIDRHYESSGTLQALRSAEIVALQPGVIRDIAVEEGDQVRSGAILARLDGRELKLQADAARIQVSNLERELERLQSLPDKVVSREELDRQRYAVEEARATASLSNFQAKQTVVQAPFGGTITARHVDEGNLANTSTPLFSLADLSVVQLELHLPEREASAVAIGSPVDLVMVDETAFQAKVVRRAPIVDPLTGTVKFTVQAEDRPESAVPGAFIRARVLVERKAGVPSLPHQAVFELEGKSYVYIVENNEAHRQEVTIGLTDGDRIEIKGGLDADKAVIAEGVGAIAEGKAVKPISPQEAAGRSARAGS